MIIKEVNRWEFSEERISPDFIATLPNSVKVKVVSAIKKELEFDIVESPDDYYDMDISISDIIQISVAAAKSETGNIYMWEVDWSGVVSEAIVIIVEYEVIPESKEDIIDFIQKYYDSEPGRTDHD